MIRQDAATNQKNKIATRERPNINGVIITAYVESPTKHLHQVDAQPTKKSKLNPSSKKPQATKRADGCNRRAQLLAYAREMRDGGSGQVQWSRKNSRPKSEKRKWLNAPLSIRASFNGIFQRNERQFGYERIASEDYSEEGQSECNKKKATRGRISNFCRKLKCMLKALSCVGLNCNKEWQ